MYFTPLLYQMKKTRVVNDNEIAEMSDRFRQCCEEAKQVGRSHHTHPLTKKHCIARQTEINIIQ